MVQLATTVFSMKKSERQGLIVRQAQVAEPQQLLSTNALARQFDVSETTIRRDFQQLASAGLIERQYGGAQLATATAPERLGQVGILLVSRIDKYRDPFYNMVLEGVDRELEQLGYHIAFVKTLYEIDSIASAERLLDSYDIKGLILLGDGPSESAACLRERIGPVITVTDKQELDADQISFAGDEGMRMMVDHLAALGRRRLAYISGYRDIRYAGFCQGLAAMDLPHHDALRQIIAPGPSGWTPDLGERGAANLMSLAQPPDAIVCASDRLAIGAMGWLQRKGYRIPDNIAVTGFDNIPDSDFTFPPLTTVHVHKVLLGKLAAERLAQRIENPDGVHLRITTPTSLVVRQSCGA
ncbi:MAG: DeoR family transcriptional regulator [Chloroflexi bacterium]|nr:DeoR family transcriptional regulator [Chloroflexota bacterium]